MAGPLTAVMAYIHQHRVIIKIKFTIVKVYIAHVAKKLKALSLERIMKLLRIQANSVSVKLSG